MANKPWHPFVDGELYDVRVVETAVRARLDDGHVANVASVEASLGVILGAGSQLLRFQPDRPGHDEHGWGLSPMNFRAWLHPDGTPLRAPAGFEFRKTRRPPRAQQPPEPTRPDPSISEKRGARPTA